MFVDDDGDDGDDGDNGDRLSTPRNWWINNKNSSSEETNRNKKWLIFDEVGGVIT